MYTMAYYFFQKDNKYVFKARNLCRDFLALKYVLYIRNLKYAHLTSVNTISIEYPLPANTNTNQLDPILCS